MTSTGITHGNASALNDGFSDGDGLREWWRWPNVQRLEYVAGYQGEERLCSSQGVCILACHNVIGVSIHNVTVNSKSDASSTALVQDHSTKVLFCEFSPNRRRTVADRVVPCWDDRYLGNDREG